MEENCRILNMDGVVACWTEWVGILKGEIDVIYGIDCGIGRPSEEISSFGYLIEGLPEFSL